MKHFVSLALIVCFVSCMVSCGSPKIEKKKNNTEISAVTELSSSSSQIDVTTTFFERTTLSALSSTSAAEATSAQTKVSSETVTMTMAAETRQTAKKETQPTTTIDTTGQIVEEPAIETVTKPVETTTAKEEVTTTIETNNIGIDDYSYQLLAEIVAHEAGMDTINIYDKAHIVSAVMNRVYDSRFPNTVYDNLIDQTQFPGFYIGTCIPSQSCYEAVDYYFMHINEFDSCNSWYGTGVENIFYFQ